MLIVRVELWSAITGERTELARMMIANEGGTVKLGDYSGRTYRGRGTSELNVAMKNDTTVHLGEVKQHPRLTSHVWNLVTKMLNNMGYGK